jgi:hypothetical protein
MSIEVSMGHYLFRPPVTASLLDDAMRKCTEGVETDDVPAVPFRHNHLHNLESWWWVTVWIVLFNQFCPTQQPVENPDLPDLISQLMLPGKLFPDMGGDSRYATFLESFVNTYAQLPVSKHPLCKRLDLLRQVLLIHYSAVEATWPDSITLSASTNQIYWQFKALLVDAPKSCLDFTLRFLPAVMSMSN